MNPTGTRKFRIGLHTRLSLGVAAVVLAATFTVATVALQLVKSSMEKSIANEEFAHVSALADAVDQKFVGRRTLLKTFGDSVEAQRLSNAVPLQAFLEQHKSLREAFDNVAFIDMDGNLAANLNGAHQIGRLNVKDRAYFQDTIAAKAGVTSQPYRNRLNGLAQVAITEPVLDAAGNVQFVIMGSINLKERNILGELAGVRFGKTGYLFIITTDGIVIDHPREERVLNPASPQTARNPEIERAMAGFEGTTESVNREGVRGLYAFKHLRQVRWIMAGMYPREEAFARIEAIERAAWVGAALLALLAGAIALGVARRQLKPLTALHRHMLDAHAAPGVVTALHTYTDDEIGDLSRTFDRLMRQRQASEKFLRDITDNLPAMVSHADAQGHYTFVNARLCEELGRGAAELVGQPVRSMSEIGDDPLMAEGLRRVAAGEPATFERKGSLNPAGHGRFFQTDLIPDLDQNGQYRGYYAMTFDVTERKRIEMSLAHSEAQVRVIADNIPALVSHVDAALNYTFVNARVRALHGGVSMVGTSMPAARGDADFAVVAPFIQRALAGETVVIEKKGDPLRGLGERTYKAHYIPDRDAGGAVQGVFAMTFDITDEVNVRKALTEQEKRLRDITDSMPALMGYFDSQENCLYGNSRARRMAGLSDDGPLTGVTLRSAVGEDLYRQQVPYIAQVLAGKSVRFPVEAPVRGEQGHFLVHMIPDRDLERRVVGFYLMTFNITALKQAELRQAESENRLRTITDNLPALITYIDGDEKVSFANGTHREWLDVDPADIVGRPLREVIGEETYAARKPMTDRAMAGERVEFEALIHTHGADRMTRMSYVPDIGADGSRRGIFSLCLDITALKGVERKLIEQARLDTLTGLPNRLAFNELLPPAILRARRAGRAIALMFLDIDWFKKINDTHGHASGDGVLVEYARRLLASVRSTDTVARLAGDEFVVVLENVRDEEAARVVARKVLAQVNVPLFSIHGRDLSVTTSIGIAFEQPGGAAVSAEELLARADAALYAAKSAGRNRFAFSA